jgi:hypothetical protein
MPFRKPTLASSPPTNDFGGLARRISSWTTNGLFTALVVVAGVGLGRQTIVWWRADAEPPTSPPVGTAWGAGFDDPTQPVELALGDTPYELTRQTVNGDAEAAAEALLALGRRAIGQAEVFDDELVEREQRFLGRLTDQPPAVENTAAGWRLHLAHEGLPLIVGTRRIGKGAAEIDSQASRAPWRVVLWGLALPTGENGWTVYQFLASQSPKTVTAGLADVPLPPDSRRVLSIGGTAGDSVIAFEGHATCGEWKRFFAGWFARLDPAAVVEWSPSGQGWHGQCRGREGNVVVQLLPGKERNTGLILTTRTGKVEE